MRSMSWLAAFGVLGGILCAPRASRAAVADSPFSFSLTPYGWFNGVVGTVGVKGAKTHVDQSFTDIADNTDELFGIFGRAEAHYQRFGAYADGGYMQVASDNITLPGVPPFNFTNNIGVIDFGLMYRLLDLPRVASENDTKLGLDVTAGARYWTMGAKISPVGLSPIQGGAGWFDPIVGLRGTIDIGRHVQVIVGGDVGGFSAASQFSWSGIATVGYAFDIGRVRSSVFAGYKAIGVDYTSGGFTWDVVLHGPVVGMSFTF